MKNAIAIIVILLVLGAAGLTYRWTQKKKADDANRPRTPAAAVQPAKAAPDAAPAR